jgi:hypothetical protein
MINVFKGRTVMKKIVFFSIALVFSAVILGCLFSDDEGKAKAIICNQTIYDITNLRFGSALTIGTVPANNCTSQSYELDPAHTLIHGRGMAPATHTPQHLRKGIG